MSNLRAVLKVLEMQLKAILAVGLTATAFLKLRGLDSDCSGFWNEKPGPPPHLLDAHDLRGFPVKLSST